MKIRIGDIVGGCFITGWILVILLFCVNGLIGLITGEIFLPNKKGGGGTLHGATARIVSLIIVIICAYILSSLFRARKRKVRPVHPRDEEIDCDLERMRERKRSRIRTHADMDAGN
jgi:hypothetical protein